MKDTFYFPHDMNANQDPKIMLLMSQAGLAGVGMYWILIEILHQQEGRITYDAYKQYLKMYYAVGGSPSNDLANVEQALISCGLLLKDDENNAVYSNRVLFNISERKSLSSKRAEAGRKSAEARGRNAHVEQLLNTRTNKAQQGKEIKGKEIGKKNSKEKDFSSIACLTEGLVQEIASQYSVSPKAVRDIRDDLLLWLKSNNKHKADYRATLQTWVRSRIAKGMLHKVVATVQPVDVQEYSPEDQRLAQIKIAEIREKHLIKPITKASSHVQNYPGRAAGSAESLSTAAAAGERGL